MDEQVEQGQPQDAAVARRKLLKAAIGTGVAVAAYSAPKISVVPAYGLTSSNRSNGLCYGLGWSSNNPTGKGWMGLAGQNGLFSGSVVDLTTGPSADQGSGTATYTWNIPTFQGIPAFTLTIVATGCVNNGGGSWVVSGMPAGYCLKFYNSGRPTVGNVSTCNSSSNLLALGIAQASPASVVNGGTVTITSTGAGTCATAPNFGKIVWVFDIAPC